jgi:hypothetical protein
MVSVKFLNGLVSKFKGIYQYPDFPRVLDNKRFIFIHYFYNVHKNPIKI